MASEIVTASILDHFSTVPDPRVDRCKKYKLTDIFFIALCATICGADGWVAIEMFGKAKEDWFTKILGLEHGIPSHDTFGNVFKAIDLEAFGRSFSNWVSDLVEITTGDIIAIDGKCLCGSGDRSSSKDAIYMVNAWSSKNSLVLGQQKVDAKSNEITAIPPLLESLILEGNVVTIDAMGCQTKIADAITAKGGDYFFSLKGNQGTLHKDTKYFFETAEDLDIGSIEYDGGHGRVETRIVRATSDITWIKEEHPHWKDLKSVVEITSKREIGDKISEETRYFITSLDATNPEKLGTIARSHWSIENGLHWVLDTAFNQDSLQNRKRNSDANLAILASTALNLLKQEKTAKVGIKNKRLKAGWDEKYLLKVLLGK